MAGFSSSAEDVIKKKTDLSLTTQPQGGVMKDDRALWKYFEIYRCLEFLQTRSRVRVVYIIYININNYIIIITFYLTLH